MKKSLKKFKDDYVDLVKVGNEFYKEHWKGMIVFTIVGSAIISGPVFIYNKIQTRKLYKDLGKEIKEY